jgi:signal transduction histidine kinase
MRPPGAVATLNAMNAVLGRTDHAERVSRWPGPRWPGPRWPGPRWPGLAWRSDLALPAVLGVVQVAGTLLSSGQFRYQRGHNPASQVYLQGHLGLAPHPLHLTVLDWVLVMIGPVALVARRRHPVSVAWLAFAATLAPSPLWFGYLSLVVAFFVAATSGRQLAAWAVLAAGYVCALWIGPLAWRRPAATPDAAVFVAAWLIVLMVAAEAVRLRRERRTEAAAARELEARHRASAEHLRMARELHDVIGHNISLINVQAGAGLDLMDTQPEQARAALAAVRTVSGQALGELRAMLAALREAGEDAPRSPTPSLARLPDLISLTQAAGLTVTSEVTGSPRPLLAAVDLAAYRIVQESLTNVARHAGPTTITVRVTYAAHDLCLEITDTGRGAAAHGTPDDRTPGNGPAAHGAGGTGIPGMRERALALGGQLEAGPRPDGGFQVRARLPLGGVP